MNSGLTSPAGGMRSAGPHAVEIDSSVFLDLPLDATGDPNAPHNNHQLEPQLMTVGRLKCGMWASFALATVFVAGAKFYFDHQVIYLNFILKQLYKGEKYATHT